jgi:hypothetical protein
MREVAIAPANLTPSVPLSAAERGMAAAKE